MRAPPLPIAVTAIALGAIGCKKNVPTLRETGTTAAPAATRSRPTLPPSPEAVTFCEEYRANNEKKARELAHGEIQKLALELLTQDFGQCLPTQTGAWIVDLERPRIDVKPARILGEAKLRFVSGKNGAERSLDLFSGTTSFEYWENAKYRVEKGVTYDYDGDGTEELFVHVTATGLGLYDTRGAIYQFKNGAITLYPPTKRISVDGLQDIDGDGRPDLLVAADYKEWYRTIHTEQHPIALVEHSLADGTFSQEDEVVRKATRDLCPRPPERLVTGEALGSYADAAERVVCARIWGKSANQVDVELTMECSKPEAKSREACTYDFPRRLRTRWAKPDPPLQLEEKHAAP